MSNVEKFEELLRSDEGLQAKLRAAVEAYGGDKSDEKAVFDATIAPMASEMGLPFTFEEGAKHASKCVGVPDEEVDALAGGGSYCFIVGGRSGDEPDSCWGDESFGAILCTHAGAGWLMT